MSVVDTAVARASYPIDSPEQAHVLVAKLCDEVDRLRDALEAFGDLAQAKIDELAADSDMAITDMVAWLLERRAEFRRQATNAPRDSVEQLAARDTADALGEVAHAITERWVKS